jgi:Flp pilus assembly protein TadG
MMDRTQTQVSKRTRLLWLQSWRTLRREEGSQLIELSIVVPMLLYLFAGAVDYGRAYYVSIEVAAAAEAGALYGVSNPTDTAGMKAAALMNGSDIATLQSSASYGSECSDGTSAVTSPTPPPSCSVDTLQYVEVDTTATYTPVFSYPGFQSSYAISGKSRMRVSF